MTGKRLIQREISAQLLAVVVAAMAATFGSLPAEASQCGNAAWYQHTEPTASGEPGDPNAFAAAHRTLPFGTHVRVENLANGRSVEVRINDRGPYGAGLIIDVTRAAAAEIGMIEAGTARVRITPIEDGVTLQAGGC